MSGVTSSVATAVADPAAAVSQRAALERAGLGADAIDMWLRTNRGTITGGLDTALAALAAQVASGNALLERLPPRSERTADEDAAAATIQLAISDQRAAVLDAFADAIYERAASETGPASLVDLVRRVRETAPPLLATEAAEARDRCARLRDKEGVEVAHAALISTILGSPRAGAALIARLRQPTNEAIELLATLRRHDAVDLDRASVSRHGRVGIVELSNPSHLNAEDDATLASFETAVDLVLLDDRIAVGALRGAPIPAGRYAGRRIFSAGLNLTALANGSLSYLFFPSRELTVVEKIYRGLLGVGGGEKPWLAVVDTFAIGGGCQLLLVVDRVLADASATLSLPATAEGFIPGAAAFRLARVVGPRLARQLMLFGAELRADSPEASSLVDELVSPERTNDRLAALATQLVGSGGRSLIENRRALRIGEEAGDDFRVYMAFYASAQARCMFGPELARNLEERWVTRTRARVADPSSQSRAISRTGPRDGT